MYPASFVGKRFTSTKDVNIFLEQISINICRTLDWVICPLFSCYLGLYKITRVVWTVQIPCKTACWVGEKNRKNEKNTERSAHKAVKSTLVSKQNTAAPRKKIKWRKLWLYPLRRPNLFPPPLPHAWVHISTLDWKYIFVNMSSVFTKSCKDVKLLESCN